MLVLVFVLVIKIALSRTLCTVNTKIETHKEKLKTNLRRVTIH